MVNDAVTSSLGNPAHCLDDNPHLVPVHQKVMSNHVRVTFLQQDAFLLIRKMIHANSPRKQEINGLQEQGSKKHVLQSALFYISLLIVSHFQP